MLSDAPHVVAHGGIRWRETLHAWRPASRALPLTTIGAVLVLALIPLVVTLLTGGEELAGALAVTALASGAVAGFFVEDPAGDTLSASPTSLARRRLLRLATLVVGTTVTVLLAVALAALVEPVGGLRLGDRVAEVAAVGAVAAAVAGVCHRRSVASAGPIGAGAGALGLLLVSSLAYRVQGLPTLAGPEHHARWWLVAVVGTVVAAWASRDPCRS